MKRVSWTTDRAVMVALGAAAGAGLRWLLLTRDASPSGFPWPVFALNVAGSAVLGVVLAEEWEHPRARLLLHDLAGIGFCGGLTTFSTLAVEVTDLGRAGRPGLAATYAVMSLVVAVAAVLAGAAALRRVRAVTLPLEEAP